MREKSNGEYSYSETDSGYRYDENRRFTFGRDYRSNAQQMRAHFGERVSEFSDRIEHFGERVGHFGGKNGYAMRLHERIWSKLYFFVGLGVIFLIVLAVALLGGLIFPNSGFLNVIRTIGWWGMIICAGIIIVGWLAGWICRCGSWFGRG